MTPKSYENNEIRDYLLGSLAEDDQRRIEERLINETGFLEELLVGEEELIDDYVTNDLSSDSRSRFEKHFLCTPERARKLRFARALGRFTSQASETNTLKAPSEDAETSRSWSAWLRAFWGRQTLTVRFASAVVAIAIVATIYYIVVPNRPFVPKTFATVTLSLSASDRAEGPTISRVKLTQDIDALKMILKLPESTDPAPGYRVELMNDQEAIQRLEVAGQDTQSVTVVIPAKDVVPGDYALHLYRIKPGGSEQRINGNYFVTVE
jgi:hypothetical protein